MNESKSRKGCVYACERCRRTKVRCLVETVKELGKCRRCYQAGADCVFPSEKGTSKRRRRTDARVNSLEQRLDALNAELSRKQASQPPSIELDQQHTEASTGFFGSEKHDGYGPSSMRKDDGATIPGYVDSGTVSYDQATKLFELFLGRVLPEFPILILSENDTFETLRRKRPLLLFAIVTAASRGRYPELCMLLHPQLQRIVAQKTIIEGQKSLELIQVVLLLEIWYCSPADLGQLNFYQWIHIAGFMALHTGIIGPAQELSTCKVNNEASPIQLEVWRTALAVATTVSIVAISLHRQPMFTVSNSSNKYLQALGRSTTSIADKRLVAWGKLQMIAETIEDIKTRSRLESAEIASRAGIQELDIQLDMWRSALSSDEITSSLEVHYLYCRCKLYEVAALNATTKSPALTSRGTLEAQGQSQMHRVPDKTSPAFIQTITSVVYSCHRLLNYFCQIPVETYVHCPTITTIRALYAINTLSALQKLADQPQHVVATVIDRNTISLQMYVTRVETFLRTIVPNSNPHETATLVLSVLDRVASNPYLKQVSTPGEHHDSATNADNPDLETASNDFEAVVVSAVSDAAQPNDSSLEVAHHFITTNAMAEMSGNGILGDSTPISDNMQVDSDFGRIQGTDFDLMCMPDLLSDMESWSHFDMDYFQFPGPSIGADTIPAVTSNQFLI